MFPAGDFFLYCLTSFATPGPNTLMALENGRRKGLRGIWLNVGMLCGLTVVDLLCLVFAKTLFDALPVFQPVMKAVGAALSRFLSRHERAANAVMAAALVYCAWRIAR